MQPQNPVVIYQPTPSFVVNQQPVAVVVTQQTAPVLVHTSQQNGGGCCSGALKCLGVTEIVFGVLILLFGIAAVVLTPNVEDYVPAFAFYVEKNIPMSPAMKAAPGIWCGIFLIVTGILAIIIREDSSKILHVANMVVAIIASLVTMAAMIVAGLAIVAVLFLYAKPTAAMHAITCVLAFTAFIITIVHACRSCTGTRREPTTQPVVHTQQQVASIGMTYPPGYYEPTKAPPIYNPGV